MDGLGQVLDGLHGVSVESLTEANNADLSDSEGDSSGSEEEEIE